MPLRYSAIEVIFQSIGCQITQAMEKSKLYHTRAVPITSIDSKPCQEKPWLIGLIALHRNVRVAYVVDAIQLLLPWVL